MSVTEIPPDEKFLAKIKRLVSPVNDIFRLLKWIIAVDLFIFLLLFGPDQIRELYRITATTSLLSSAGLCLCLTLIAVIIWFAARLVAFEADHQLNEAARFTRKLLAVLPIVLAGLPLVAAAFGHFYAIPDELTGSGGALRVGTLGHIQSTELRGIARRLLITGAVLSAIAAVLAMLAWRFRVRVDRFAGKVMAAYFRKTSTLFVSLTFILALTVVFWLSPVALPQALTVFGIVCLFTFAICAFAVHVTLLTDRSTVAVVPIILIVSAIYAGFNINENHAIRTLPQNPQKSHTLKDASSEFIQWLSRPDRVAYVRNRPSSYFPVFVVAVQGGGAYAAYNAAIFLARIQDLCPNFRHHLFALSSVSGGSVGAAAFAAALDAEDQKVGAPVALNDDREVCPLITRFLAKERPVAALERVGPIEARVSKILEADLLSPLVAATLFPDFTQKFLPFPVRPFDRARALEYAFEASAASRLKLDQQADGKVRTNILEKNFFDHWDSTKSSPALLINAADAGSGKRTVIAPFNITDSQAFKDEVCMFADSTDTKKVELQEGPSPAALLEKPIPLSAAAFISARFPWVTPAATITTSNPCFGSKTDVRLVDGGYLDNSGVETATALVERLRKSLQSPEAKTRGLSNIGIHLISLTGGDFPQRSSYAFSDAMEPIRALLSGRESRAYIALNRAKNINVQGSDASQISFARNDLRNMFYRLPLGWSLSQKTRSSIARESGQYWDCEAGATFQQTNEIMSNADCIQLQANFLMKGVLPAALTNLERAQKYKASFNSQPKPKLDSETFLICYEKRVDEQRRADDAARSKLNQVKAVFSYNSSYLTNYQADNMRAVLREWDELGATESDPNMLAFIMASLSIDTLAFRKTAEFLTVESEQELKRIWGPRLDRVDSDRAAAKPSLPKLDRASLLYNPEVLADIVWNKRFGNNNPGDTWRYRARGFVQIIGREQYAQASKWINYDLVENPDTVGDSRAAARIALAYYLNWKSPRSGKKLADFIKLAKPDWVAARKNNTDQEIYNPPLVAARSEMVLGCINEAIAGLANSVAPVTIR